MNMKFLKSGLTVLSLLLLAPGVFAAFSADTFSELSCEEGQHLFFEYEEEEIKDRIEKMECLVEPRYTNTVKGYLMGYMVRNREKSERILGRAVLYFPLFEEYLAANEMPDALKYLPVVESALNPQAVSRVGATGLWQFMDYTGKEYGLKINRTIDERSDPMEATKAAIRFLNYLHDRFGKWELALAAYNAGGGRVSRAMKRSRSSNFWKMQRYLPRETRGYVPAFIAATYLMEYYHLHQLEPAYPELDLQLTESIQVYDYISFFRIAQITELPIETIEELNPAFNRGFIPASKEGHSLILPSRVSKAVADYLALKESDQENTMKHIQPVFKEEIVEEQLETNYAASTYVVQEGEQLEGIAQKLDCSVYNLIAWNDLEEMALSPNQQLNYYTPTEVKRFKPFTIEGIAPIDRLEMTLEEKETIDLDYLKVKSQTFRHKKYLYYVPTTVETWAEIADHFDNVSVESLIKLNNARPLEPPRVGSKVKIRKI